MRHFDVSRSEKRVCKIAREGEGGKYMKFRWTKGLGLAACCVLAAGAAGQNSSGDPYAPLRLAGDEKRVTAP